MSNCWNDLKDDLDQVHAGETLKENTKAYLIQKTKNYRHGATFWCKPAAVLACLALFLLAAGGYGTYFVPTYTISVDVNPSIELGINRYDKVVTVQAFNEDGASLIAAKDLRFLDYRKALRELLATDSMEPYLSQDYLIDITVFGKDENKSDEILGNLTSDTSAYENVHCASGNSEDVKDAHSHGMSCGKYQAFLDLYALDPSVTAEEVQKLSTRQIRERIRELSNETSDSATDETPSDSNQGHGGKHHGDRHHGSH